MRGPIRIGVVVTVALLSGACEAVMPDGLACTQEARASLSVKVLDARSGSTITPGSTIVAVDGAYIDSIVVPLDHDPNWRATPERTYERPGTYGVVARRAGYADGAVGGIIVTADRCHVDTRQVDVRLEPVP